MKYDEYLYKNLELLKEFILNEVPSNYKLQIKDIFDNCRHIWRMLIMKKTVKIALIPVGITHCDSLKYKYKQVLKKIKKLRSI